MREVGDGDYAASYTPVTAGDLLLSVTMQLISSTGVEEMHISGSPFRVKVDAAGIHAPSCTAVGTGVAPSFARTSQASFGVTARDNSGSPLPNRLAGPVDSIDPFFVDVTFVSKDGTPSRAKVKLQRSAGQAHLAGFGCTLGARADGGVLLSVSGFAERVAFFI